MKSNLDSIFPFLLDDVGVILFIFIYLVMLIAIVIYDLKD